MFMVPQCILSLTRTTVVPGSCFRTDRIQCSHGNQTVDSVDSHFVLICTVSVVVFLIRTVLLAVYPPLGSGWPCRTSGSQHMGLLLIWPLLLLHWTLVPAPKDTIEPHAREYHSWGVTHTKLLPLLKEHFDEEVFGLGCVLHVMFIGLYWRPLLRCTKLREWLNEWDLKSSRKQSHTFLTIVRPIEDIQKRFPNAGAGVMRDLLRETFGIRVPKYFSPSFHYFSHLIISTGS